ncbi:hypothetical protein F2P81_013470 [Scophthalmus maximus]|uniref:Uncharacterized protein n=1 Tax=Scophthalmus maximus TaxID=52904 RepID=A0A6A4SQV5_SCOMX|nr:hypothetical protein F2P81_013470 [Scophthalmus maximus]
MHQIKQPEINQYVKCKRLLTNSAVISYARACSAQHLTLRSIVLFKTDVLFLFEPKVSTVSVSDCSVELEDIAQQPSSVRDESQRGEVAKQQKVLSAPCCMCCGLPVDAVFPPHRERESEREREREREREGAAVIETGRAPLTLICSDGVKQVRRRASSYLTAAVCAANNAPVPVVRSDSSAWERTVCCS